MAAVIKNDDGTSTVWHGAYGWRTTYEAVSHWYAGSDPDGSIDGFVEVLEIQHPPPDRQPFWLHVYYTNIGSVCFGFSSLDAATAGREEFFKGDHLRKLSDPLYLPQLSNCMSVERAPSGTPWIYEVA